MKLSLTRRYAFPASHRLCREDWSNAQNQDVFGKCANVNGHGHNYTLEVTVSGRVDPETGMIVNLADLDEFVQKRVLDHFDHANLNEQIPEFREVIPTTENLCRVIFSRLSGFNHGRIESIRVEETSKNSFEYIAESALTREGAEIEFQQERS